VLHAARDTLFARDNLLPKIPSFRHDLMHARTTEAPLSGARFTRC
jgi:hypothetical protein